MSFVFEDGVLLAKNKHVHIARKRLILNVCSETRILFYFEYFLVLSMLPL